MRLPGLVRYLCACVRVCARPRVCVCQPMRERERETEMRVGVCMWACGCVGGGDMVYGCECEGGQDENSDYTYLCLVYSLLIIFECVSYCLFYSAFL